jgi:hypothetical protein
VQVPEDYDATHKYFAAQGARVIALARRALPSELSGPELRGLSREEVETEMHFEGFAVFQVGGVYVEGSMGGVGSDYFWGGGLRYKCMLSLLNGTFHTR